MRSSWRKWVENAATRYDNLYEKSFEEIEAGELLHSASFQKKLGRTGADSKNLQQYDRFGIVSPCVDFEPEKEFDLKYKWSEKALHIARKGYSKFGEVVRSKAFTVEIRGAGVLGMKNELNAWMNYFAHVRAAGIAQDMPMWSASKNPFILELAGILDTSSDNSVRATDLNGFKAFFACGTRKNMHDLPLKSEDVTSADPHLHEDFQTCVKEGAKKNQELKENNPGEDFLQSEVVVRVVLSDLQDCYHETALSGLRVAKQANVPELADGQKPKRQVEETENPVLMNFLSVSGCRAIETVDLPQDLQGAKASPTYRGMLLGKGLPVSTLVEVLVDPADVVKELGL